MSTHLAAVSPSKGQPFQVQSRLTPKPGPGELLIAVKAVALNPADIHMRNMGLFIPTYPTVIGFDLSGLVLEIGDNVPTRDTVNEKDIFFQPGVTRIAAYTASFWRSYNPDYGAFQERCLVPWQHAVPLPDESMSWSRAATLPVSVEVPLSAWDALKIPRTLGAAVSNPVSGPSSNASNAGDGKVDKRQDEALLVWGGSSSVGTMGVQSARLLKEDPDSSIAAVYVTSGPSNETYVRSLGADRVFDYNDPGVVSAIVSAAKSDGVIIRHCFLATGQVAQCQAVLKAFLGHITGVDRSQAKIASAPILPADMKEVSGVETVFVQPSSIEMERLNQFQYWLGTWLRENLAKGVVRPSPQPKVIGKGLEAINLGLDILLQGVSCSKLVVEIEV